MTLCMQLQAALSTFTLRSRCTTCVSSIPTIGVQAAFSLAGCVLCCGLITTLPTAAGPFDEDLPPWPLFKFGLWATRCLDAMRDGLLPPHVRTLEIGFSYVRPQVGDAPRRHKAITCQPGQWGRGCNSCFKNTLTQARLRACIDQWSGTWQLQSCLLHWPGQVSAVGQHTRASRTDDYLL